jgi:hypothetical protein
MFATPSSIFVFPMAMIAKYSKHWALTQSSSRPNALLVSSAFLKEGEVIMEGTCNGKEEEIITGESAARITVKLENLRDFTRGLEVVARTQEGKMITAAVLTEINRVIPRPDTAPGLEPPRDEKSPMDTQVKD